MKLSGGGRITFVHRLDVIEEHGERNPVVECVVKDDDKVVFVRGREYV